MVGSGIKDKSGSALVYRSQNLKFGWECVGPLCESNISSRWECPIMAKVTTASQHVAVSSNNGNNGHLQRHMFCVSPDYCVNMAQYYLGDYAAGKFELENAVGPLPLDLGDVMYAPNVLTDKHVSCWLVVHTGKLASFRNRCCLHGFACAGMLALSAQQQ
eukprot:GHUV01048249.1.p2 GENE.GHUV01048249.1~~GHUV01048249.1.p2  ORF type:complete len:160 (-),score=43.40 GHUV01048249.1:105-584(-)